MWETDFYPVLVLGRIALSLYHSMRVPNPSPVLDENRAPMGPEILSSTGTGLLGKAPKGFPDSTSVLDKFQSAIVSSQSELRPRHPSTRVSRPSGPKNREKVSKKSSWAFLPRVSKKSRKGRKVPKKSPKSVLSGTFRPFWDFFETLGRKAQEDFVRFFRGFRPGGPRDSCRWAAGLLNQSAF